MRTASGLSSVTTGCGSSPDVRQWARRPHAFTTVARNRLRASSSGIATTPPAIAPYTATQTTSAGPSQAPIAASSFTSPPPIARSANSGRNSSTPTAHPARLHQSPASPLVASPNARPTAAAPNVSAFGSLRVDTSTAAAIAPSANTAIAGASITAGIYEPLGGGGSHSPCRPFDEPVYFTPS